MRSLVGERACRPYGPRVPINIDSETRQKLRDLLFEPEMRGVGYSEFIERAVARAREELETERRQQLDSK